MSDLDKEINDNGTFQNWIDRRVQKFSCEYDLLLAEASLLLDRAELRLRELE